MKVIILLSIVLVYNTSCAQNTPKQIVESFINDLKSNEGSSLDVIEKYFLLRENINDGERNQTAIPLITNQMDMIRLKLNSSCTNMEIVVHDDQSKLIQSFKLKTQKFDTNNIYYVICDDSILMPVLTENSKIISISVYSKSETGTKNFVMF